MLAGVPLANVVVLVHKALGDDVSPYPAVKPVTADFNGDGQPDLAVVVDFNRKLNAWLKQGVVILNLDSPSLAPLRRDNEQHFCFGLLFLDRQLPSQKTLFYGCFSGWRLVASQKAALDLDMESGEVLRLYHDGTRFRTRRLKKN
jgi:hypothetical protein